MKNDSNLSHASIKHYIFYYIPKVFLPLCDLKRYPPTISNLDYLTVERDGNYVKMILLTK